MELSSDEESGGLLHVARRLGAFRQQAAQAVESALRSRGPLREAAELEQVLSEATVEITAECLEEQAKWQELLGIFTELKTRADDDRHYEQACASALASMNVLDDDDDLEGTPRIPSTFSLRRPGKKATAPAGFMSAVSTTSSVLDDVASFFSPTPLSGTHHTVSPLEVTAAIKQQEQASARYLYAQLRCVTETAKIKTLLGECASSAARAEEPVDTLLEWVDRTGLLVDTKLWPALQSMTYQTAVTLKTWTKRVEKISVLFAEVVAAVCDFSVERCVRELRSELLRSLRESACASCYIVPASYRWRCCGSRVCQRCVCATFMKKTPADAHLLCPHCTSAARLHLAFALNPISTSITELLIARLHP